MRQEEWVSAWVVRECTALAMDKIFFRCPSKSDGNVRTEGRRRVRVPDTRAPCLLRWRQPKGDRFESDNGPASSVTPRRARQRRP